MYFNFASDWVLDFFNLLNLVAVRWIKIIRLAYCEPFFIYLTRDSVFTPITSDGIKRLLLSFNANHTFGGFFYFICLYQMNELDLYLLIGGFINSKIRLLDSTLI